jgi:hypothetical protein
MKALKTLKNIYIIANRYRPLLIIAGVLLNVTCGFGYVYFINSTIHNAVALDKAQSQLLNQNARIAELESKYISLTNTVTLDFAYARGFADASSHQSYVAEKSLSRKVSFNAR